MSFSALKSAYGSMPAYIRSSEDLQKVFLALNTDIYAYIAARVRQRGVAEDITQEVFIKVWEKRTQYNPQKGSLKNWIYAIALNAVRDYFRRQKGAVIEELPENIESSENVEDDISKKHLHTLVLHQLQHLSKKEQDLLTLRYVQEFSIEEIGEILHMKYSATKVALHRATKKLQDRCNRFAP